MKITFLIHNVYAIGGTIRTTLNLAAALADRHEVTIVSMLRHRTRPRFVIDPRVTVVPLVDIRENSADGGDPLLYRPAEVFPTAEKRYGQYSRLTDHRAREYLRSCDADVIIGTRPGVNVYLARFAPPRALRIAQEHLTHDMHTKKLRAQLARDYRDLDAVVTTTDADAAVYRAKMRLPGVRILAVPNGVPDPGLPPTDGSAPVIAAAGRLVRAKRFDLLIEAFTDVAAKHPDWSLRIYGAGTDKERLQRLIEERGLGGRAALMGAVSPIEAEFAKASIVASASDAESFGMTLAEAMRCGIPVVATDCPLGPAEIINDGVDGRLVPMGDRRALAAALSDLVADEPGRRGMGEAARAAARRFDPAHVAHAYEELFGDLAATRSARAWQRRKARWRNRAGRALRRLRSPRR
ncbi:glycosyltransferase family 4 protein [Streptomyces rapamycinicus]|uniref:D-inositol 3-phosphate glycosyltransferase n=2 Tax=Streptomyces rapamycinicus TaxID=1226757 RepID=A0A0A0NK83_STRRN|nr:glycosyltransferase family 4 protein [Streptomyces rapamycinicus]AGP59957.1 glycosyl transferase [Streptomyces rapamycinicus NRRL 5491]MBB4788880.1 glycosyltransferase involved in cell wall biosynthesis [Streptomyces rapamycinicus]RLV76854.1 glycosyl transferase [Streptomyces rapamycinicus NRRL 5491]UTO67624.1 glycosyltransferase family 4 protein [Streptomyces rapamycinicus]UTP35577.1 glycosyltransferase family 4 protein [Streptomyces rapamycinicus NRRL 5491]